MAAILISLSFLKEWERLSNSGCTERAWAALNFRNAIRILENKLAFGLRTLRLVAFPIAFRFFTNWLAFVFGCLAVSDAMRLFADSYAFRAVKHFAAFIRAFNFAFGFFAFNIANCVFRFGA